MTLIVCWIRRNDTLRELVVAADSRVGGGERWDSCPKVLPLPRPATVMAMSGDATPAYAFLIHAINTCHLLDGHTVGRTDIRYLAHELERVYDDSRQHVSGLARGQSKPSIPDIHIALAGWSWRRSRFEVYTYRFNDAGRVKCTESRTISGQRGFRTIFIGDGARSAERRLRAITKKLQQTGELPLPLRGPLRDPAVHDEMFYDWEPLQALIEECNDPEVDSVGGHPQVARIYQYGAVEQFVWEEAGGTQFFGGRPVLDTERSERRRMSAEPGSGRMQITIEFSNRSIQLEPVTRDDS